MNLRQLKRCARSITGCLVLVFSLSACASAIESVFEPEKKPLDEFSVYARPPLSIPPVYGLRVPKPGSAQEEDVSTKDQALAAIIRRKPKRKVIETGLKNPSPGLVEFLADVGIQKAPKNIRSLVNEDNVQLAAEDDKLVNKLVFWKEVEPKHPDVLVDAAKEQRRILENQALGLAINEGKVPEVKRKQQDLGIIDLIR